MAVKTAVIGKFQAHATKGLQKISLNWTEIGFSSNDGPEEDLREVGLLGLLVLLDYIESAPKHAVHIVSLGAINNKRQLPLAKLSFSCLQKIMSMLKTKSSEKACIRALAWQANNSKEPAAIWFSLFYLVSTSYFS